MSVEFSTFIGVEVCASRSHPFTFAVVDTDLVIRSIGSGSIKDAFAFLAGQENAMAAINSCLAQCRRGKGHKEGCHGSSAQARSLCRSFIHWVEQTPEY